MARRAGGIVNEKTQNVKAFKYHMIKQNNIQTKWRKEYIIMENKILAKVGELTVMESEVSEMVARMMQSGQNLDNPQGRTMVLEQLIANKLFLLDAKKNMYE